MFNVKTEVKYHEINFSLVYVQRKKQLSKSVSDPVKVHVCLEH